MVEPCLENFKNNDIKNSCIELDRIWVYNKNVLEKIYENNSNSRL